MPDPWTPPDSDEVVSGNGSGKAASWTPPATDKVVKPPARPAQAADAPGYRMRPVVPPAVPTSALSHIDRLKLAARPPDDPSTEGPMARAARLRAQAELDAMPHYGSGSIRPVPAINANDPMAGMDPADLYGRIASGIKNTLTQAGRGATAIPTAVMESRLLHRPDAAASLFAPTNAPTMANPTGQAGGAGYDPTKPNVNPAYAFGRGYYEGMPGAAGGTAGAGAATAIMAPYLSLIPNPLLKTGAGLLVAGVGGLGGATLAAKGSQKLRDALLDPATIQAINEEQQRIQQQQPTAFDAGSLAAQGAFQKPSLANSPEAWINRAAGASIAGGVNAAQQKVGAAPGQPIDWMQVLRQAAGGALLSGDNTEAGRTLHDLGGMAAKPVAEVLARTVAKNALKNGTQAAGSAMLSAAEAQASKGKGGTSVAAAAARPPAEVPAVAPESPATASEGAGATTAPVSPYDMEAQQAANEAPSPIVPAASHRAHADAAISAGKIPDDGQMLEHATGFGDRPSVYPPEVLNAFDKWANREGAGTDADSKTHYQKLKALPKGSPVVVFDHTPPSSMGDVYVRPRVGVLDSVIEESGVGSANYKQYKVPAVRFPDGTKRQFHASFIEPLEVPSSAPTLPPTEAAPSASRTSTPITEQPSPTNGTTGESSSSAEIARVTNPDTTSRGSSPIAPQPEVNSSDGEGASWQMTRQEYVNQRSPRSNVTPQSDGSIRVTLPGYQHGDFTVYGIKDRVGGKGSYGGVDAVWHLGKSDVKVTDPSMQMQLHDAITNQEQETHIAADEPYQVANTGTAGGMVGKTQGWTVYPNGRDPASSAVAAYKSGTEARLKARSLNASSYELQHRAAVESALSKGQPVPANVLADYPDLAAKYATPTQTPETVTIPAAATEPAKPKPPMAGSIGLNTLGVDDATKAEIQADAEALGLTNKPKQKVADIRASARVQGLGVEDIRDHKPGSPPPNWSGTLPEYMDRITGLFHAAKQAEQTAANLHRADPTEANAAARDQATIDRAITQRHLDAYRNAWGLMGNTAKGPSQPFFGEMAGRTADEILKPEPATQGRPRRAINPRSSEWGKTNKLISREEYEANKAAFRSGIAKAHTGLDPELLVALTKMAAFHIEAGARRLGEMRAAVTADIGDEEAKKLTPGDWLTIHSGARAQITQRVKAAGGAGSANGGPASSEEAFAQGLSHLGSEGTADYLNRVRSLPNGPDVLDRFIAGGKAALSKPENDAVTTAYLDTLAGVKAGQKSTAKGRQQAGAVADLLSMAQDARKASAAAETATKQQERQKAQEAAKAQKATERAAAQSQRQQARMAARTAAQDARQKAQEAARVEASKPVNRFVANLAGRMGKAGAENFRATLGEDLLTRLVAGDETTAEERAKIGDAYLSNLRQGTQGRPVSPIDAASRQLQVMTREARTRLEQERIASLSPKEVVKEQLLRLAPDDEKSPEFTAYIRKLNNDLDGIGDTDTRRLANYASEQSATVGRNLLAYYRSNLLSGPQTIGKIGLAHMLYMGMEEAKRAPAAAADAAMSKAFGNERTVQGASARDAGRALKAATTTGAREGLQILKGGEASLLLKGQGAASQGGTPGMDHADSSLHPMPHSLPTEFAMRGKAGAVVNPLVRAPMRIHGAIYHMMNTGAMERGLSEQANLSARTQIAQEMPGVSGAALNSAIAKRAEYLRLNPTDEMLQNALAYKAEQTFTNENAGTKVTASGMHGLRKANPAVAKGVEVAGGLLMPFQRVPGNVAGKSLEYVGGAPYAAARALHAKMTGRAVTPAEQRIWANTFGRGATGAGAMLLGYAISKGLIPGLGSVGINPPNDKEHEYGSVTAAGRDWSTGQIEPAFAPFATGADMGAHGFFPGLSAGMIDALRENPYLRLADTAGSLKEGGAALAHGDYGKVGKEGAKAAAGIAGGFIPYATLLSQAAAQFDPTGNVRKKDTILDILANRIPGLRYGLPETPYPEASGLVPFLPSTPTKYGK